eukprot:augustus_masked-scaffold_37-processed-gene-2.19-mRNA-1 protein AED:1.00 eAED:1.00 QI:0/-1/0/0/-1/1/1/0/352
MEPNDQKAYMAEAARQYRKRQNVIRYKLKKEHAFLVKSKLELGQQANVLQKQVVKLERLIQRKPQVAEITWLIRTNHLLRKNACILTSRKRLLSCFGPLLDLFPKLNIYKFLSLVKQSMQEVLNSANDFEIDRTGRIKYLDQTFIQSPNRKKLRKQMNKSFVQVLPPDLKYRVSSLHVDKTMKKMMQYSASVQNMSLKELSSITSHLIGTLSYDTCWSDHVDCQFKLAKVSSEEIKLWDLQEAGQVLPNQKLIVDELVFKANLETFLRVQWVVEGDLYSSYNFILVKYDEKTGNCNFLDKKFYHVRFSKNLTRENSIHVHSFTTLDPDYQLFDFVALLKEAGELHLKGVFAG